MRRSKRPRNPPPYWPQIDRRSLAWLWVRWIKQGRLTTGILDDIRTRAVSPILVKHCEDALQFCAMPNWRLYA